MMNTTHTSTMDGGQRFRMGKDGEEYTDLIELIEVGKLELLQLDFSPHRKVSSFPTVYNRNQAENSPNLGVSILSRELSTISHLGVVRL